MPRILYLLITLVLAGALRGADVGSAIPRGGKFEWARLKTTDTYWDRHADTDRSVMDYLRTTTRLNMSSEWQSVRADSVDSLRRFPLIFCKDIKFLTPAERRNFGEYLRRGGFMLIDACRNEGVNSDIKVFLRNQLDALSKEFTDLRAVALPPSHEIFSVFFKMTAFPPARPQYPSPLYAVYSGDRMIGVIGLNGFMCAAQGLEGASVAAESAKMIVNIYIYALTR